jgi:L-fucose isomerase-like protein
MYQPRVGSYAVYEPPEEGWENWEAQFAQINAGLAGAGLNVIAAPEAVKDLASCQRVADFFAGQNVDVLHALIITWSFDHFTIELQQRIGKPVAIRAIPGIRTGSVVGSMQLNCVLSDIEVPHRLYYGETENKATIEEVAAFAKACAIQNKLRGARMAVIGRRTEGMTPTAVDEVEVLRLFGTRLLNYGLDEIQEMASQIEAAEAEAAWGRISAGAAKVMSKTEHGLSTARNYLLFKRMVNDLGLSAITIGSYPQCQGTMCVPIAWLNDEGIPTGCEGDVNSTLCMLILSLLTDDPVHFGEMLAFDEEHNALVTSHCGCGSPSLADAHGYTLQPVRLANNGVCIRYAARPGPVTYVNFVGRKGNYRLCAIEGEAVKTGMVFEGNPLRFELKSPLKKVWETAGAHGLGHHWMTAYGHVTPTLVEYCRLAGIKGIFPDLDLLVEQR